MMRDASERETASGQTPPVLPPRLTPGETYPAAAGAQNLRGLDSDVGTPISGG